jgi:tight adherence protein C
VVALKIIGGIGGLVGGLLLMGMLPISPMFKLLGIILFTLIGYVIPSTQVNAMAAKRQRLMQKQLADVMDLLTISVEAGLGFDQALSQVVKNVPGPLAEEMSRLLQEIQIGVGRGDAFRHLGERTNVPELEGFVLSMIQADLFGVSIANVLRAQSKELRVKRRQRAEEIAQKIPVKLLFPMIFMVLPALFIIVLGPGAIQIYNQFFSK